MIITTRHVDEEEMCDDLLLVSNPKCVDFDIFELPYLPECSIIECSNSETYKMNMIH